MFWLAEVFNGSYSKQEMRRFEEWAHQQRAKTVARMFAATGRAIKSSALALRDRMQRERRRRASIRELNALSDRALKDIGLVRGEIRSVVNGLLDGRQPARALAQSGGSVSQHARHEKQTGSTEAVGEWRRAA